ncbi:MAG: calcium/proton exchanger [Chloroflexota bacterium]
MHENRTSNTGIKGVLQWIGLDLSGDGGSSGLQIGIYAMLVFFPVALIVKFAGIGGPWLFITSALAIIPLAKILSASTEQLVTRVGPGVGGLLNATFSNAVEMIIAFFALNAGLFEVVRASISGAIIGNVLFVLGLSFFLGGMKRDKQVFNRTASGVTGSQLILAATALLIPTAFVLTIPPTTAIGDLKEELSIGIALILLLAYVAQMIFFLRTHKHLYENSTEEPTEEIWPIKHSVTLLLIVTVLVGVMADILVEGLDYLTKTLGLTELFVGVILIALVGSAAENVTAVVMAMKNKMDLALNIAMSSTLQIALFVAPVLVLLGLAIGKPFDLVFNTFEVVAVFVTMLIANAITHDGESNWFEGVQLLAAYAIIAIAFFFHP